MTYSKCFKCKSFYLGDGVPDICANMDCNEDLMFTGFVLKEHGIIIRWN